MTEEPGKITVTAEQLQSFLELATQGMKGTASRGIGLESETHREQGEDYQKTWYHLMVNTVSKLADTVEKLRSEELVGVKKELKEEIDKVDKRVTKNEDALNEYKKDIIKPLNDKLIGLDVKFGIYALLASAASGGLVAYLFWLLKLGHSAVTGGPPPIGP